MPYVNLRIAAAKPERPAAGGSSEKEEEGGIAMFAFLGFILYGIVINAFQYLDLIGAIKGLFGG